MQSRKTLSSTSGCGCTDYYEIGTLYDLNTGEIISQDIVGMYTNCGGSGGYGGEGGTGGGSGYGDSYDNTAIDKIYGSYNWKSVGNARGTTLNNLSFTLVHTGGQPSAQGIGFVQACVTIPKSLATTNDDANKLLNKAYSQTLDEIVDELNRGVLRPGDMSVKQVFKNKMNLKLGGTYINSNFTGQACDGNMPTSLVVHC